MVHWELLAYSCGLKEWLKGSIFQLLLFTWIFFSGWTAPRFLSAIFRTWINLPYTAGDYLTDGLFREVYPHYQDASFFHDETGVSSPTPYGDLVDVLLSDAPSWILKQYDTIIVAGEIREGWRWR